MSTNDQDRWERLAAALAMAGVEAQVSTTSYSQVHHGRVEHGVRRSIFIRNATNHLVEIADRYGRGGKWYGWAVYRSDEHDLIVSSHSNLIKRSEVVTAVLDEMSAR